jgi:hypothetical protein
MAFPNVSDIVATTIENRSKDVADNVTQNNALLKYIDMKGNTKTISGGRSIYQTMSYAENTNAGFYSGYDPLPTAQQDVLTAAEYSFKQAAAAVVFSGLEELQNAGREQIIDLISERVTVAENSLNNVIARSINSDGTGFGGKEIDGLKAQIVLTPTTGTVGGIDRASWSFWRNKSWKATTDGGAVVSASNIRQYMNRLWTKLIRGTDMPNLIILDDNYYNFYLDSLQLLQRFTETSKADSGFQVLKFQGADVVLGGGIGGNMPTSFGYFLNTRYLFWRPHSKRNMVPLQPGQRVSVNQDATVKLIGWAGNLTCSGMQFQGCMGEG